ncbi:Por secretion system C-terminal sorting domain-containing protein [Tenacibaculum sp. MAR_2010_89]|uniref:GEVED domain-containing protein n=2 Tax=Tenacibaculum TaxID=104267 RepID=UPI00089CA58A|nr:GEVED domain-containing protein [Tenacibaculum sp. MAR_2010_89]SEE01333.1 Por secretion system C-terminal sorting domain-containing protein [Tenacibaculum sp. MAR_2010_89]
MKHKYFKSLVVTGALIGLSFQAQLQAQNKGEAEKIRSKYDLTKLNVMKQNFQENASNEKQQALRLAKKNGWKTQFTTKDGSMVELQRVVDGKPIYYTTFNVDAAKSTRTNHLHSGGTLGLNVMGQGMTAHVWDGGLARTTHQEYDGAGGNNRFSIGDGTTTKNFHAAHVTGTIIASGVQANAKGMAPHAKAVGYDWNSDKAEATTAAANGMLISNHSYGYRVRNPNTGQVLLPQHYFGGYITESRAWDEIMFNAPNYLMVVAAGNDGNDNTANNNPTGGSGFDKLTGHSTSKNNLVVANAQDANVDASGNLVSVSINSSSSEGPTDDFRIKPDITGNGTGVYSTYESSDTAYNSITGTSMASPNVTGSLLLLQQHNNNTHSSYMRAATLKGLALHTADDAGASGPDAVFGWGLLNTKKAAQVITQKGNQSKIEELTLTSGQTYTITVDSDGTNPLLASISWTDRPGTANTTVNSTTPVLVNDLDLRVTKGGTTNLPYELTGATTNAKRDNNVDPFERVDVSGASGTYTITVTHKGSLTGGSQNYSLIVTGITGTPVVCNATVPTGVSTSGVSATGATVNWTAVSGATYDVRYRQVGTSSWTTSAVSGTTKALSGLSASTQYEAQVRSKCSSGNSNYSASVNFTTTAVQINYCASSGNTSYATGVTRVVFGSIDKADGPAKNVGYENFTNLSTTVSQSSSVNLTVSVNTDGNYRVDAIAWIDWNQDGDFADSGETYDLGNISNVSNGALPTKAVAVPANAKVGATRMRVSARYNANPTSCQTNFDGEVEDYTVNVQGAVADTQAPSAPSSLVAASIAQTTLTLNWTASTDNVGVTGYDVFRGSTKIGSTTTATSYNVTGLTANTAYSFTVKAKDAAGNVSSSSNTASVTTLGTVVSYCDSKGTRVTYEWIDYVSFGGMTNTTGANGGYGDFTSKVATVTQGSTNQLVVSAGFRSTAYNEYFVIWIDYNGDGDFTDSGEQVTSGNSTSSGNRTANITIPGNAKLGQTRMRVSMKYNSAPTSCEANIGDGEVEDYTVNITASSASLTTFSDVTVTGEPFSNQNVLDLMAYPNPATNFVQVKFASKAENMTYRIVNTIGSVVKSGQMKSRNLDVSNLNSGIYMLEVNDGQKSLKTKIVKK